MAEFTLQLLHVTDQEGAAPALVDAPNLSAVLNALEDDFENTLILSSGDLWLPGLFYSASAEIYGFENEEGEFEGVPGIADILINSALGFEAVAFGNHEFDQGTGAIKALLEANPDITGPGIGEAGYLGAAFPYLSANLDFSADPNLSDLVVEAGQDVDDIEGNIATSAIATVNGEKIGLVGATTPTLPTVSSPGDDVDVNPDDPNDFDALADIIQAEVDALLASNPDLNKVILLSHMQVLDIEVNELAPRLSGVDIIIGGGSDSILADESDRLRDGDEADGPYPIIQEGADGNPVAIVNTDGQYLYVGQLVIDFNEDGVIILDSIDPLVSGAYATDEEGVAALGAEELTDPIVTEVIAALNDVIEEKERNIFGVTEVFLNGRRSGGGLDGVRNQETNLGNLTAEANLWYARQFDEAVDISIKNGGGIRESIGTVVTPPGGTEPVRVPPEANPNFDKPEGGITQTDVESVLAFNNGLSVVTATVEELKAILEHAVSGATEENINTDFGSFAQVAGIQFSFDIAFEPDNRVRSLTLTDDEGNDTEILVQNGEIQGDPTRTYRIVTLNFLADGGSGYPIPQTDRVDLVDFASLDFDGGPAVFAETGSEQDAFAEYLTTFFPADEDSATPVFMMEDTVVSEDERIQNLFFREDTVIDEAAPPEETTFIFDIQGAGHISPLLGDTVTTTGIVTAVDTNGFYLQDAAGDGDSATADALFVFTGGEPGVTVGDALNVTGTVSEFTPGGPDTGNLSTTQISGDPEIEILSSGNDLPAAVIIGEGGRIPPNVSIDDDAFASFDPETDGIDFFESLEAMRVTAQDALAISGTNRFGEIFTVVDGGESATGISDRGTLNISPDDFNPEKVQIDEDSGIFNFDFPNVDVGASLGNVTGVVGYSFGNFEIYPTEDFTADIAPSDLEPEVSEIQAGNDTLTVASYNVLNLDPKVESIELVDDNDEGDIDDDIGDGRFAAIAQQIVTNLNAPDIIGLQEIQDNDGAEITDVSEADETLQTLVDAIAAAGGPTYEFIDTPNVLPTFIDDEGNVVRPSGGQPGGNIRNAFLYNSDRVDLVEGSVQPIGSQEVGATFEGARRPLSATFEFNGEEITIVNNHFSSKGGSAPILGVEQPFEQRQEDPDVNGSLNERRVQAQAVNNFVDGLFTDDADANVMVLGDLNEFEFISPLDILAGTVESIDDGSGIEATGETAILTNLVDLIPEDERYSFIFQGNSQVLDHILVSDSLLNEAAFDFVHTNVEFAETDGRASDHEPILASLDFGDDMTVMPIEINMPVAELLDLTGFDGDVTANVTLDREAAFDNILQFYETDAAGSVDGLLPGESGYEDAVRQNLISGLELFVENLTTTNTDVLIGGGTYYAPALLVDGDPHNLVTLDDMAMGMGRIQRTDNIWEFEDFTDFDFNDLVLTLNSAEAVSAA